MPYKKPNIEADTDQCSDVFHEGAAWIILTSTAARTEIAGQPRVMVAILINKNFPPPQDVDMSELIGALADSLKVNVARVVAGQEPIWREMLSDREKN